LSLPFSLSLTGSLITHEDHIHFHSLFAATAPSSSSSSSSSSPPPASATRAPTHQALKLEICSGAGEWAAAQALQDAGKANWITLELRHGRVYQTFVRMMMESVHNLCVVGGDANVVMVRPTLAKAKRNRIAVVDLGRCGC
jgi:tRNA G46 methylase TrmB